ncbi:hypothetical protein CC79DRAFT_1337589 [Sarocladium strictum]
MPLDDFPPPIAKGGIHTGIPAGFWKETLPESPANLDFVPKRGNPVPRSLNPARQKGEEAWLHVSKNSETGHIAFVWKDAKRSMANGRFVTYYDGYNEADAKILAVQNYDTHEEALKREFNRKVALTIVRSRLA